MDGSLRRLRLRPDVVVERRNGWIYLMSSRETLRLRDTGKNRQALTTADGDDGSGGSNESDPVRRALLERGVLIPENAGPALPTWTTIPPYDRCSAGPIRTVRLAIGEDEAVELSGWPGLAGLVPGPEAPQEDPLAVDGEEAPAHVTVVSLRQPAEALEQANRQALAARDLLLAYLISPSDVFLTLLWPPETPCLTCLVTRIRSTFAWQDLANLAVGQLLGGREVESAGSPARAVGLGLLAHFLILATAAEFRTLPAFRRLLQFDMARARLMQHPVLRLPNCQSCQPRSERPSRLPNWPADALPGPAAS